MEAASSTSSEREWLADVTDEPWALVGRDGVVRDANAHWERWFPDRMPLTTVDELLPSLPWTRALRSADRYGAYRFETETTFVGQARPVPIAIRVLTRDDRSVVLHARSRAREVEKEHLLRSYAELAEQHQASLGDERRRLRDVLDAVPSAILSIDAAGRQCGPFSAAARELLGAQCDGASVWGSLFRCVAPDSPIAQSIQEALDSAFADPATQWPVHAASLPGTIEYRSLTDTESRFLRLEYVPVHLEGALTRILVVAEDNSVVARLQRELLRTRQRAACERLATRQVSHLHPAMARRFVSVSRRQLTELRELTEVARTPRDWQLPVELAARISDNARALGMTLLATRGAEITQAVRATARTEAPAQREHLATCLDDADLTLQTYEGALGDDHAPPDEHVEGFTLEPDILHILRAVQAGAVPPDALGPAIAALERLRKTEPDAAA